MTRASGNLADLLWVVDEAIPITASLKQVTGNALMVSGRDVTPAIIEKADGLLVRSVTQVDEALLAGSAVRFVGTATAGIDHLDVAALARLGRPVGLCTRIQCDRCGGIRAVRDRDVGPSPVHLNAAPQWGLLASVRSADSWPNGCSVWDVR